MKIKVYKAIFSILILCAIIILVLITIKYVRNYINEQENKKTVETFFRIMDESQTKDENIQINGYNIIGIVKIPKINIEYPILDLDIYNPEETKEPMKYSIVKYWGGKVNEYGNLSIAGHNNYDGTMFGKTKRLVNGDIIELTDLDKHMIQYEIYDIFITDPNDITILETKDEQVREVTLITCTNGNSNRLILKAREIL